MRKRSTAKTRSCSDSADCQAINSEHACLDLGPHYHRAVGQHNHKICAHKRLMPLDWRDYTALALATLVTAIAAGGGVGGGGLLLPLLILIMEFTPHDAAPLANVCVLGGAAVNVMYNTNRRHPNAADGRPLISYEVAASSAQPSLIATAHSPLPSSTRAD